MKASFGGGKLKVMENWIDMLYSASPVCTLTRALVMLVVRRVDPFSDWLSDEHNLIGVFCFSQEQVTVI